jgi:hypothetical protein
VWTIGISFSSLFYAPPGVGVKITGGISTHAGGDFVTGLVVLVALILWGAAAATTAKEETVTLAVTGMT